MKLPLSFKMPDKGIIFLAISQFGMAFANNFVMVIMPFYILKISPYSQRDTVLWIGMVVGGASITTTLAAPFWGGLTARISPKFLFERGLFCSAFVILFMGFASNIQLLFFLRLIQGALGGASTIGLILTSQLSTKENIRENLSLFQNSITAGQLLGPPLGAYAATAMGYRFPFFAAFAMIFIFLIFCHRYVRYVPPQGEPRRPDASLKREILCGWLLCFIATLNLIYMPGILPFILRTFQLKEHIAVSFAGIIMMSYTASSIFGSYLLCRLSSKRGLNSIMVLSLIMASFFQLLLITSENVFSFGLVRMLQTAFIAAVFPLTISIFARKQVGGKVIGLLNSARFLGNAVGPLLATTILAFFDLASLYMVVAFLTLLSLFFFLKTEELKEE